MLCIYRAGVQEDHTVCAVYVQERGAGGPYCVCCVCMYRAGCWMTILCVLCMYRAGVQEDHTVCAVYACTGQGAG